MRVESEALRQGLQERPHGEGSRVGEGCGRQVNPNPNPDPIRNPKPNRARGVEPLARVIGIGIGIALGLGIGIRVGLELGLEATPVAAASRRSP